MFRIALKSALARKGRLLLTSLAVIAGCSFLSGVFVFSDTIRGSFDRLFANAYENTDAVVRSANVIEADFGAESRDRISATLIDEIRGLPGVAEAEGDIQGFARIATADGAEIGQTGPPKFGGVWIDSTSSPWSLAEGTGPADATEVVIDRRSAKEGDIAVGDIVQVTSVGGVREVTVSGIATFAGSDTSGGATWALFDLATAQEFVIGQPGLIDFVAVVGDGSASDEQLVALIEQQYGGDSDIEALTGVEITEENQTAVQEGLQFFTVFLTIFAVISLFVGSFIIYNVFSISAAQRQRENALLRAIGASRGQVTRVLFVEAIVVGLVGGLLGFAGGVALATGIIELLTATGFGPSDTALTIKPWVLLVSVIVGVVVTLICAIAPAIRSGRVPPLAAMRDVAVDRSALSRGRMIGGVICLAGAAGCTVLGVRGDAVWLGPGVAGLFAALVVLGPLLASPVSRVVTKPLTALRGVSGEIAGRNAATSPKRTALTAGALAIGLALLIGVSTLGSSIKTSIREAIGEQFTGDFTVSTSDQGFGGLPEALTDELNALPEVDNAVGIGIAAIQLIENGEPVGKQVLTVDPERAAGLFDLPFSAGGWEGLDANSILLSADKAERDGLAVGDRVQVVFLNQERRELELVGTFERDDFSNVIVSRDLFEGQTGDIFTVQVLIRAAGGQSVDEAESAIRTVTDAYPTGKLETREEFIDSQSSQVDSFLNFIYALLLMSVFIAVLGIVITLLLAVYERRRELGLVRAIGMTRPQVRSSIRWEAMITALLGALMGTVLGLTLGWIVVKALEDQGLTTFSVSTMSIVIFVVLSVLIAVVAAWWPARRAAGADILQAIATT